MPERSRGAERRKAMETCPITGAAKRRSVAGGQNAERQWRHKATLADIGTNTRSRGAERRKAMETGDQGCERGQRRLQ